MLHFKTADPALCISIFKWIPTEFIATIAINSINYVILLQNLTHNDFISGLFTLNGSVWTLFRLRCIHSHVPFRAHHNGVPVSTLTLYISFFTTSMYPLCGFPPYWQLHIQHPLLYISNTAQLPNILNLASRTLPPKC